jgi:hypothetical protein
MKALFCSILAFSVSARAAQMAPPAGEPWRSRRVYLLSDDERVELYRRPQGLAEVFVCRTPCGATVQFHPSDQFVLTGPGIRNTAPFLLKPREEDLTLHVSAGSTATLALGGVLFGAGTVTTMVAGMAYAIRTMFGDVFCEDPQCAARNANNRNTALAITLTGVAAALAGGAILIFAAHPTRFTSEP